MFRRAAIVAFVLDVVSILVFVIVGLISHHKQFDFVDILVVLWPFLGGLVIGWALTRSWRAPFRIFWNGVTIWVATVLIGMILRAVSGQDVPIAFVGVTALVLGVLFLGWRAIARLVTRGSRKRAA
jgi:Protein of unknown function (DUF3054)